jgi:hypothetical protein
MTWPALLAIIASEVGSDACARIAKRAGLELQGLRVTIGARPLLTREDIDRVAPGRPAVAARKLGVSKRTVYRALNRDPNPPIR